MGAYGSNVMYLSADILDNLPCTDCGIFEEMGLDRNGDATIERTVPHELGHNANANHPFDDNKVRPKNVMNQSIFTLNPGKILEMDQLKEMMSSKLNNGIQKIEVNENK